MNALIVSGGSLDEDTLRTVRNRSFDQVIGVDGGLRFCKEQGIRPTRIVGDFDTLEPEILDWYRQNTDIEIRAYDPVKDATDTQIAVELAMELGCDDITILGGTGTRLDHVLGNIQTLYLAYGRGISCRMVDAHNRIRLIGEGEHFLDRAEQYGDYISLIPYTEEATGVTLEGMKYPLRNHRFTVRGSAGLGVSNEITEKTARIVIESGVMILVESRD